MSAAAFARYARHYDLLYRDKDYAAEARLIGGLLGPAGTPAGTLLDVGCGTGAHAREFVKLGWRVSGVDLSPEMIAIARERTPAEADIRFAAGAAAEFELGRTFAAAVSLFHVVSYQTGPDEAFRMFANVRRHLAPGGIFVFDFWHGPGVLADPPAVRVRRMADGDIRMTRISEPAHRPEQCQVDVAYEVLTEEPAAGRIGRVTELHRLRYFFLPELEFMLVRAGFSVALTRAGISEQPLDARAWYGLIVARAQ